MAIAFDATSGASEGGSATVSWTHTPVGTPRGVLVFTSCNDDATGVSTVTYGGTSLTEVTASPATKAAADDARVTAWFLGTSISTGAQTVQVDLGGTVGLTRCTAITLTAAADMSVVNSAAGINSDSLLNPSATLTLSGETSFVAMGFMSGVASTGSVTPLSGWTSANETLANANVLGTYYYDTVASADVTYGWTASAEDAVAIAVAVKEDVVASSGVGKVINGGLIH